MEFENLQAFIAVADESSFSRASERLFITQPAVSIGVRRGEKIAIENKYFLMEK